MITTIDNPYNPFTNFEKWYRFDMRKGYNTCGILANLMPDFTGDMEMLMYDDYADAADKALLELNPFGMHIDVSKEIADRRLI